jgi:disulfide oxidoreductase YuzD
MYEQFGTNIALTYLHIIYKINAHKSTTMKMAIVQNFYLYPVGLTWMQSVSK